MRRILKNRITDLIRKARAKYPHDAPAGELAARDPGPPEHSDRSEMMETYRAALHRLTPLQQEATVMRLEHGENYSRIAEKLALPSAGAARMCVNRGLVHLRRALRAHDASSSE